MSTPKTQPQPIFISSAWFRSAYDRGLHSKPVTLTEETLVNMARRMVSIALDDGEITEEQLRYEVGLLVGTLLSAM